MHSLAMAQDILAAALNEAKKHKAKHIQAMGVKIGGEHFAESDSLQFCLEAVARGTIAEGVQIEIELVDTFARCRTCALTFPVEDHFPICPYCGDRNPEILGGDGSPQITLKLG